MVGSVPVGGGAPIAVQSMTNTDTCDVAATGAQIRALERVGADIVRVSVPTREAAEAFRTLCAESTLPLVADIHFDYQLALLAAQYGAACLRINPGNIGKEERIRAVVDKAREKGIPIRIGVNGGSLERDLLHKYREPCAAALVESALRQARLLERLDFHDYKLSLKASDVHTTLEAYRAIAAQTRQPLHLGVTEAGGARSGAVKSAVALGALLMEGIGDTLRVSLAADPVEEVRVAYDLLKSLGLRSFGINFIACPGCARQNFDVIAVTNELERRLEDISAPLDVAIIGCYVNGPGESRGAHVGVTGASPRSLIYVDGKAFRKTNQQDLLEELERQIRARAAQPLPQQL